MANKTIVIHEIVGKNLKTALRVDDISFVTIRDEKTIEIRIDGEYITFECDTSEQAEQVYDDIKSSMKDEPLG
jgi:hypothetical protein